MIESAELKEILSILYKYAQITLGWGEKYAKWTYNHSNDQTLLIHSFNQASLMIQFLETIVDTEEVFSDDEQIITVTSAFFADSGKALNTFQEAVINKLSEREAYNHVNETSIKLVEEHLAELQDSLESHLKGMRWQEFVQEVLRCVCHHQVLKAHHLQDYCGRFGGKSRAARLVTFVDVVTSQKTPENAVKKLQDDSEVVGLIRPYQVSYHRFARIRGIITVILNNAIVELHKAQSFIPLLYYTEGIVYISYDTSAKLEITPEMLKETFDQLIQEILEDQDFEDNFFKATFGSLAAKVVPQPAFLNESFIRRIIHEKVIPENTVEKEIQRIKKQLSKKERGQQNAWEEFLDYLKAKAKEFGIDDKVLLESFCKFKNSMAYFLEIIKVLVLWDPTLDPEPIIKAKFPFLTLSSLNSYSGGKPIIEKLDYFLNLSQSSENKSLLFLTVEGIERLEQNMITCARELFFYYEQKKPAPYSDQIFRQLLLDIQYPSVLEITLVQSYVAETNKQLLRGKKKHQDRVCFFCNMKGNIPATAGIVGDGSQKFSNSLIGGKSFGKTHKAVTCEVCLFEGSLRQIIAGFIPQEVILVAPEMNFTPEMATRWIDEANYLIQARRVGISPLSVINLDRVFRNFTVDPVSTSRLLTSHQVLKDLVIGNQKVSGAVKSLSKDFIVIENFNRMYHTDYTSFDELVEAIFRGDFYHDDLLQCLEPSGQIKYIYQYQRTPHYFFIFLQFEAGDKDAPKTARVLQKMAIASIISMVFSARVKFIETLNSILPTDIKGLVDIPRTALLSQYEEIFLSDGAIMLHNRNKFLKVYGIYSVIQNIITQDPNNKPENDFLLRYAKYSRGFILHKLSTRVNREVFEANKRTLVEVLTLLP